MSKVIHSIAYSFVAGLSALFAIAGQAPEARAQATNFSDGELAVCLEACAKKTQTLACVSFDDYSACLKTVPECSRLGAPSQNALGEFCRACGNASARCDQGGKKEVAPAAPSQKPKPSPSGKAKPRVTPPSAAKKMPPPATDEALCRKKGGVWYLEEVEDKSTDPPTAELKEHCQTLTNALDRISKLERALRRQQAGTGSMSQADLDELDHLRKMGLPDHLADRLREIESGLDILCPPIDKRPDASLKQRCLKFLFRIDLLEIKADEAVETADYAKAQAEHAQKRITDLEHGTSRASALGGYRPRLRLSAVMTWHAFKTPYDHEAVWGGGLEGAYYPNLTPNLSLVLLGGFGISGADLMGRQRPVTWGGAGLASPVKKDDFLVEGLLYAEHWYGSDERSTLNFYGGGAGFVWMPGASVRKGYYPVPALGVRAMLGDTRLQTPDGGTRDSFDAVLAAHALIAF